MHVLITQSMPEVNDFNAEQVAWPDRQVVKVDHLPHITKKIDIKYIQNKKK